VAAKSNVVYMDIDSSLSHAEDPVTGGIRYMGQGRWKLPEAPGIGADFDPDFLESMNKIIV
jgi:L-alanine-DL-glutamate epimerase-like enolase superfamily enzyme